MARTVMMKHPGIGLRKDGFYGFSWTTFFFSGFPAIFRGDLIIGLVVIIASMLTFGFAGVIWAFFYNKNYTIRLLEKGYVFSDLEKNVRSAKRALDLPCTGGNEKSSFEDIDVVDISNPEIREILERNNFR